MDIAVKAFFANGRPRANYAAASLAAVGFLVYVRGLPLDELTVETPVGMFEVVKPNKDTEYGVLLPECKLLRTKTFEFGSCIELSAMELVTKCGIVRIFECPDATAFSEEALAVLSLGDEEENVSAAVALSRHNECVKMRLNRVNSDKESPLLDAILAAGTLLFRRYPDSRPVEIELLGMRYTVARSRGGLLVSAPISFMSFVTPYF